MATKTLILRPTGWYHSGTAHSGFPTETPTSDYHLLVAEEEADDDATYIQVTNTLPSSGLLFTPPNIEIVPNAIRIVGRCCTSISNSTVMFQYYTLTSGEASEAFTLSEQYANYIYNIPSDVILGFWENIVNFTLGNYNVSFYAGSTSTGKGTSANVKLTQLYLEVDYDDGNEETITETIYTKENNLWVSMSGTIYKKIQGAWIQTDSSSLRSDTKYTISNQT